MRHVIWAPRARADAREIHCYVSLDSVAAADRLLDRIDQAAESLSEFPLKGRPIRRGLRQLSTVYPYVIRYRVIGDRIEIARTYHGARHVRSKRVGWSGAPLEFATHRPSAA